MRDPKRQLEDELAADGYVPGTPAFEHASLQRRVQQCQLRKGVVDCTACDHFEFCGLAKQYLTLRRSKTHEEKPNVVTVANEGRLPDWMFPTMRRTNEPEE